MSFLRRIWQRIRHPTGFVGYDLEGNAYYERSIGAGRRPKRTVQYQQHDDMWKYIGGSKRLPIQWSAWLAHTRLNPPTLQELQYDLLRQQRVLHNARLLEAEDQKQREIEVQQRQALQVPAAITTGATVVSEEPTPLAGTSMPAMPSSSPTLSKLSQYHTVDIHIPISGNDAQTPAAPVHASSFSSSSEPAKATAPSTPSSRSPKLKSLPNTVGKDDYKPESWTPTSMRRVRRGQ